jgi:hypothetical protein
MDAHNNTDSNNTKTKLLSPSTNVVGTLGTFGGFTHGNAE